MKDRKENDDHLRARFLTGEISEMHIAFAFHAPHHLRDLFFKRDDLFLYCLRFKRVGCYRVKYSAECRRECRRVQFIPRIEEMLACRKSRSPAQKIWATVRSMAFSPKFIDVPQCRLELLIGLQALLKIFNVCFFLLGELESGQKIF